MVSRVALNWVTFSFPDFIQFLYLFSDNTLNKMYWPGDYAAAAAGDGELTGADRLKTETLANPELSLSRDTRTLSDERTQDTMMALPPSLPSLTAHPHKGAVQLEVHICNRNTLLSWRRCLYYQKINKTTSSGVIYIDNYTWIRNNMWNWKYLNYHLILKKYFKNAFESEFFTKHHTLFLSDAGILKKKQLSPIVERNCLNRIHNELCEHAPGTASPQGSSSSDSRVCVAKPSLPDHLNGVAMSIKAGTVDGDSSGSEWVSAQAKTKIKIKNYTVYLTLVGKKSVPQSVLCRTELTISVNMFSVVLLFVAEVIQSFSSTVCGKPRLVLSSSVIVLIACSLSRFHLIILNVSVKPNEDSSHPKQLY